MAKIDSEKRDYSAPELRVYGSVRDLTGAASGTTGDGIGMGKEIK